MESGTHLKNYNCSVFLVLLLVPRRDLLQVNQLRGAAEARALESDHGELIRQRRVRKPAFQVPQ